ncbi:hypothetical protein CLOM_g7342 [Closterium sp. NIES-68]|nr:hypothetical protein CLOM_g7342 [Closterium sp. NIES-68]
MVECCWKKEEGVWEFMRVRTDKEHPNAWHTYLKVMDSIRDNITEEVLLKEVQNIRSLPVYEEHEKSEIRRMQQQRRQQHPPPHHHQQQQRHHHPQHHPHHHHQQQPHQEQERRD